MQRILAIQIKRIGDLILTAPTLRLLRHNRPDAHITLVTAGAAGQLACCIPGIDDHLNYRSWKPNLGLWSSLLVEPFDVSLDFNGTDRSVGMSFTAGATIRATYSKRAVKFPRNAIFTHTSSASLKKLHTIDHMAALLETIGISPSGVHEPRCLEIPVEIEKEVERILQTQGIGEKDPFVVIHPGTAREEKYWSSERWAAVARELIQNRQRKVVITGGRDVGELAHIANVKGSLREESSGQLIDLSARLSLPQTAAVIARAQAVLGVDTAAMHLAAAFEKPQLVLFGPTSPYHWRPLHQRAKVIVAGHEKPLRDEEFQQKMPQVPMEEISVAQVIDALDGLC